MRFELFVGLRYLFGKKEDISLTRISTISIITVTLAVAIPIVVLSVMNGFHNSIGLKLIANDFHIQLIPEQAGFKDYQTYCDILNEFKETEHAMPFYEGQGLIKYEFFENRRTIIKCLRPEDIEKSPSFYHHFRLIPQKSALEKGMEVKKKDSDFDPSILSEPDSIAIGEALGHDIHTRIGRTVFLIIPENLEGGSAEMQKTPFKVAGFFSAGYAQFDKTLTIIPFHSSRNLFDIADIATGVGIFLKKGDSHFQFVNKLQKDPRFKHFKIYDTQQRGLFQDFSREKFLMQIVLFIMVLAAFSTIYITLHVIVMDKRKEIGILKSMGISVKKIQKLFVVQGLFVGIIGSCLGLLLGIVITLNIQDFVKMYEFIIQQEIMPEDVFYLTTLPYQFKFQDMFIQCTGAIFVSLLASYFPAYRASKQRPVDIIRMN